MLPVAVVSIISTETKSWGQGAAPCFQREAYCYIYQKMRHLFASLLRGLHIAPLFLWIGETLTHP